MEARTRNIIQDLRNKDLISPLTTKHQISQIQRIRDKLKLSAKTITEKKKLPDDPSSPYIVLDFVETDPEVRYGFLISSKTLIDTHLRNQVDSSGRLYVQGNYCYIFSSFLAPKRTFFGPKRYFFGPNILIWYYLLIDLISIPGFHEGRQTTDVRHIV